ncbi:hypothetical protein IWQ60_002349 [Tieghemiomyces parasiticus]|uniref:Uncharacterized protein n=1 Tax=Tieghemiomyces parasiticus TaxID=78921 RepID=A0A9W8AJ57_9FUNG|nr:hypothetical protein IWQ60_002349 [Tieghemiomyces parasiticus]
MLHLSWLQLGGLVFLTVNTVSSVHGNPSGERDTYINGFANPGGFTVPISAASTNSFAHQAPVDAIPVNKGDRYYRRTLKQAVKGPDAEGSGQSVEVTARRSFFYLADIEIHNLETVKVDQATVVSESGETTVLRLHSDHSKAMMMLAFADLHNTNALAGAVAQAVIQSGAGALDINAEWINQDFLGGQYEPNPLTLKGLNQFLLTLKHCFTGTIPPVQVILTVGVQPWLDMWNKINHGELTARVDYLRVVPPPFNLKTRRKAKEAQLQPDQYSLGRAKTYTETHAGKDKSDKVKGVDPHKLRDEIAVDPAMSVLHKELALSRPWLHAGFPLERLLIVYNFDNTLVKDRSLGGSSAPAPVMTLTTSRRPYSDQSRRGRVYTRH